ncbi:hypothetical protein H8958_013429 [Nasalis larvatus]
MPRSGAQQALPELTRYFPLPAQELVNILHKALEAAQQEKRASSAYLAGAEDKDRLELVQHKVRQIVELGGRVEALEQERESLAHTASLREQEVQLTAEERAAAYGQEPRQAAGHLQAL